MQHRFGGPQELSSGAGPGARHQQPARLGTGGPAQLPGVEHRAPDVRVHPGTGQESFMGIDQAADVVPG
ncbi:hypothetical protein RKD27_002219 [Streptomyces sp. SAI-126]|uniref:hypothetical protein n=1 Tax=unclassified Streptomyces TaxID=2593676 RepID=UPI0036EF974A